MRHATLFRVSLVVLSTAAAIAACSADAGDGGFEPSGAGGGSSSDSDGEGGLGISTGSNTGGGAGGPLTKEPECPSQKDDPSNTLDVDMDGQTAADGDCNDCTWQMNTGAQDYDGNAIDEDCNGAKDDNPTVCDMTLAIDSPDPLDGARALDLCKQSDGVETWGVLSAEYVMADGGPLPDPLGHGILSAFGPSVNVQQGSKMLVLSSGAARAASDPGFVDPGGYDKFYTSGSPPGYPKESPSCPGVITGTPFDSAALRVRIKSPTNAKSFRFKLNFYTYEFPVYICSTYNDFMVAMLTPIPSGQTDGNISFDSQGNTISVNAGFLEVCYPQMAGGKNFPCGLGPAQLSGTGFDSQPNGSAATSWLQTTSPLETPGADIELLFAIWDSGDGILDSTVLLDDFAFEVEEAPTETIPIPEPK
jgi:hypothetical protein